MLISQRGSGILSRFANYYPERLSALIFVSAGYIEPGAFDLGMFQTWYLRAETYSKLNTGVDAVNSKAEQAFGCPTFGYWKLFDEDDAAEVCYRYVCKHSQL